MKYVIGSGWYSQLGKYRRHGDFITHMPEFHLLWYEGVKRFTNPVKIIISDSNSPLKPLWNKLDDRIEYIEFDANKHTNLPGWSRGFLMGLSYAWLCDADYYVYIEQDCLIYGEGIIENVISNMKSSCILGDAEGVPWNIQQSFVILSKPFFLEFLSEFPKSGKMADEEKFLNVKKGSDWYEFLPFGYGRKRPINFEDRFFYFQHGVRNEIENYIKKLDLDFNLRRLYEKYT